MKTKTTLLLSAAFLVACSAPGGDPLPPASLHIFKWSPEQQQIGFRNIEKIWPTRVVKRGDTVFPLPFAARSIDPDFTFDGVDYDTGDFMDDNHVSGLLVLKDGEIVLERYGLGRGPEDRWISFSVTKSITSMLVGAAIKDEHIKSLEDRVTRYIPELQGSAYERVTLRHLLTMRSGVSWNEDYTDPNSDVGQAGLEPVYGALNPLVRYMKQLPRAAPPGRRFHYNTAETDLAGILVSAAVGKPLSQYLSEKIWIPFGMESDAVWLTDTGLHERGGCCLAMTLRDYGRVGLFMLNGGKAQGKSVGPATWVTQATRAHVRNPGYGYFWWVGQRSYRASGIYGQTIIVVPRSQLVIAINSAWPNAVDDQNFERMQEFVRAVDAAVR